MLAEAGISRDACRITNVTSLRPPGNEIDAFFGTRRNGLAEVGGRYPREPIVTGLKTLRAEIEATSPNLILAVGNTSLWALTGQIGVSNWRGSMLETDTIVDGASLSRQFKVLPIYHPAAILRQWSLRNVTVHDLRRAVQGSSTPLPWPKPHWDFNIEPTVGDVERFVAAHKGQRISLDIETTNRYVSLVGLAASKGSALTVPLMTKSRSGGHYWNPWEEDHIVGLLRDLLENSPVLGQNLLYDCQYMLRHLCIMPNVVDDTLLMQHVCFPGTPKDLSYLSSLYCRYHRYWKDDLKDYKALPLDEAKFRRYNCTDAVITFEVAETLREVVRKLGLADQYAFQMSLFRPVLSMMVHGIRVDRGRQRDLVRQLSTSAASFESFFEAVIGQRVGVAAGAKWYKSPKQLATLFYEEMAIPPIRNRKTQQVTTNDEALVKIGKTNPLLHHLCESLRDYRSLEVYHNTFATAGVDPDDRIRCSFNITGTETFRFSSSENAFGSGTNLQNIPRFDPKTNPLLPNVRAIFVPDPGYVLLDWDLDRADLQVVVWEANDAELKQMLRAGVDMHKENAKVIFGLQSVGGVSGAQRQVAKGFIHGTNYGGSARTMAINCGITVRQAEIAQARWFGAHPGIKAWHNRTRASLVATRKVRNAFGFQRIYFDRPEGILSEALAWVPQSTVAITINKGLRNIYSNLPWVRLLLQVHDSLVMQIPQARFTPEDLAAIRYQLLITIPYHDPLVIPVGLKASEVSWGEVKEVKVAA